MVAGLYAPGRFCQKNFSIISVMTGNYSDQTPNNGLLSWFRDSLFWKNLSTVSSWGFTIFNPIC